MMVTVKYSCHRCGTDKRNVRVDARTNPEAYDVVHWLENIVRPAVTDDHANHSPFCSAKVADIMLPASGEWVGAP